ncbi:MAG: hypothetical protein R3244_05120, partial [Thermoanaerobaculia bacterium]|nr:hypothetical protein [Thermoanaerobaculia bacterium]
MTYPGDTSLSDEIKQRILTTFEQALDLTESGSRKEALLGCDFVLRLDPLFEPARVLHKRLRSDEEEIATGDLRAAVDGDLGGALDAIDEAAAELEPAEIVEPPPAPEADDTAAEEETASFHEAVEEALDAPADEDLVEEDDDGEEPSVDLVAEPPPPDVPAPEEPEVEALEPETSADAEREAGGDGEPADSDTL